MYIRVLFEKLLRTQRTTSNSEYPGKLRSAEVATEGSNLGIRGTLCERLGRLPTAMKDTCAKREEKLALLERPTSMAGMKKKKADYRY